MHGVDTVMQGGTHLLLPYQQCRYGDLWLYRCRMENAMGRGTHLTPSGLDFDEHSWYLGAGTSLRTGASIGWPRQLPIPPGVRICRLLKVLRVSCPV